MTADRGRARVLDVAASCDARALYAGLQAAMEVIIDQWAGADGVEALEKLEAPILRALAVGDTYGSPAHLASIEGVPP